MWARVGGEGKQITDAAHPMVGYVLTTHREWKASKVKRALTPLTPNHHGLA
jgi:hypothetical protein